MHVLNEKKTPFWLGVFFAIGANLLWGLAFLIPKILSSFTSVEITLGRYFFYGITSFIIFLAIERKHSWLYNFKIWFTAFLFAFAGNIGYYFFLVSGIRYAGAPITALIIGSLPITVSLYGNWLRREYPFFKLLPSIVMIFIGLFIINSLEFDGNQNSKHIVTQQPIIGLLSALIALILWTWYSVANSIFLKKNPHISSSTWSTLIGINTLILSLAVLVIMIIIRNDALTNIAGYIKFDRFDNKALLFFIGSIILGVVVSWGGTLMWNKASALLPVSLVGQLIVLETICGLTYVYIYDFRLPSFFEMLGIIMIIGGVIIGIRNTQRYIRNQ